jgi:hypothetical protein
MLEMRTPGLQFILLPLYRGDHKEHECGTLKWESPARFPVWLDMVDKVPRNILEQEALLTHTCSVPTSFQSFESRDELEGGFQRFR